MALEVLHSLNILVVRLLSLEVIVGIEPLEDLISVPQILTTACAPPADHTNFF